MHIYFGLIYTLLLFDNQDFITQKCRVQTNSTLLHFWNDKKLDIHLKAKYEVSKFVSIKFTKSNVCKLHDIMTISKTYDVINIFAARQDHQAHKHIAIKYLNCDDALICSKRKLKKSNVLGDFSWKVVGGLEGFIRLQ